MRRLPILVFVWCLLQAPLASAHPTPSSTAILDFSASSAWLVQDSPVEDLERGMHVTLTDGGTLSAATIAPAHAAALQDYARQHLQMYAIPSEYPWSIDDVSVESFDAEYGPRVRFRFHLRPPSSQSSASVRLEDDIIVHEVKSHYTVIYVRRDFSTGMASDSPRLVGTVHASQKNVLVQRDGSFLRGLGAVAAMGMSHITTGTDHVLFLLMLVLPAPLLVSGGRFGPTRSVRSTLAHLAGTVTAFTVGHSVTLAAQTLGAVNVPGAIVEPAIALSILVTALHALRPIAPRAEVLLAGGFGLLHGLAFATALTRGDLRGTDGVLTLLGFNVGIEAGQLLMLARVVPWVLLLAQTSWYKSFRVSSAILGMSLALGWGFERLTGRANPLSPLVALLERHPWTLLAVLAALALLAYRPLVFKLDSARDQA